MAYNNMLYQMYNDNTPGVIVININYSDARLSDILAWCQNKWPGRANVYSIPLPNDSYFVYHVFVMKIDNTSDPYIRFITNNQEMAVEFSLTWS